MHPLAAQLSLALFDARGMPVGLSASFAGLAGLEPDDLAGLGRLLPPEVVMAGHEQPWELVAGARRLQLRAARMGEWVALEARASDRAGADERAAALGEAFPHLAEAVSHEARTPLNTLSIHLEVAAERLAKMDERLFGELERHFKAMRDQVKRIDAILKRFLRFASPQPASAATVDLAELMGQVVEVCGPDARRRNVKVDARLEAAVVQADVGSLGQALLELLVDGIDVGAGGGKVEIEVDRRGGEAVLSLVDRPGPERRPAEGSADRGARLLSAAGRIVERERGVIATRWQGETWEVQVRLPLAPNRDRGIA